MSARTDEQWPAEAQQWANWDVNAGTKAQAQQLVAAKDVVHISELFGGRVAFGTAGLRAVMGPDPAAMNDLVAIQASQGICKYLAQQFGDRAKSMGVALGYDRRQQDSLSSERFAELPAAVCFHAGFKVYLREGFVASLVTY